MLNLFLNIFVAELLWRQTLDKVNGCIPWVPNLMTLSHTSPFLILLWFNFIFDNFTHSCPEFCSSLIVQSRVVTIHNSYSLFKLGCIFLDSEYTRYCGKALLPSLSGSRNILLKKTMKPLTVDYETVRKLQNH